MLSTPAFLLFGFRAVVTLIVVYILLADPVTKALNCPNGKSCRDVLGSKFYNGVGTITGSNCDFTPTTPQGDDDLGGRKMGGTGTCDGSWSKCDKACHIHNGRINCDMGCECDKSCGVRGYCDESCDFDYIRSYHIPDSSNKYACRYQACSSCSHGSCGCNAGLYNDGSGCNQNWPAGYFCANSGLKKQPCPAGKFSGSPSLTSVGQCKNCPAGKYSQNTPITSSSQCQTCPNGQQPSANQDSCVNVPCDTSDLSNCNGNGVIGGTKGNCYCTCNPSYFGTSCQSRKCISKDLECQNGGNVKGTFPSCACDCPQGYAGVSCQIRITPKPTPSPSSSPTLYPTAFPTYDPTISPTLSPTVSPSSSPTALPSQYPTSGPTKQGETISPTTSPTTANPTLSPTTAFPTTGPTTASPTISLSPTASPTLEPSSASRSKGHDDSSEKGMIAGIIVGILMFVFFVAVIYHFKKKQASANMAGSESQFTVNPVYQNETKFGEISETEHTYYAAASSYGPPPENVNSAYGNATRGHSASTGAFHIVAGMDGENKVYAIPFVGLNTEARSKNEGRHSLPGKQTMYASRNSIKKLQQKNAAKVVVGMDGYALSHTEVKDLEDKTGSAKLDHVVDHPSLHGVMERQEAERILLANLIKRDSEEEQLLKRSFLCRFSHGKVVLSTAECHCSIFEPRVHHSRLKRVENGLQDSNGFVHSSLAAALDLWSKTGVLNVRSHVLGKPCLPIYERPIPLVMRAIENKGVESASDEEDVAYDDISWNEFYEQRAKTVGYEENATYITLLPSREMKNSGNRQD